MTLVVLKSLANQKWPFLADRVIILQLYQMSGYVWVPWAGV